MYFLYAKEGADFPPIVGFQVVHSKTGDRWNDRPDAEVLSHETALADFREASQQSEYYRLTPVCDEDLEELGEPLFEVASEQRGKIVGFQVTDSRGYRWNKRHDREVLAFKIAMQEYQEAESIDPGKWKMVVIYQGDIEGAEYLTDVLHPNLR